ncbi:HNH endonuclease [Nocardia terpenica]|uniref:HNH endonuclease n=1 Tax=Nocardia terpenica TaxID=455432 RepID=UPI002FE1DFE8
MTEQDLPLPDSPELTAILPGVEHRLIYRFLYERRERPPTRVEITEFLAGTTGKRRSQWDRRLRELYPHFRIDKTSERIPRYTLVAREKRTGTDARISGRIRAQVLQPRRCAMCGRTPLDDGVKLVVDHKVPQAWGGSNDVDNLQPLCAECNAGKKDYFKTFDQFAEQIRQAASYDEPQRRIGELLLAFGTEQWIRSDLLAIVANAKEFQEDWHRRLRDLRFIGWDYTHQKRREGGRVRSYYRLTRSAPWPDNIIAAIRAEEASRKAAKPTTRTTTRR